MRSRPIVVPEGLCEFKVGRGYPSPSHVTRRHSSDRYGPSWGGPLGDTVQIDWTDETGGACSERITVLAVTHLADRGGNEGYVAYKRHYAIKVLLTSLGARVARWPQAYQLLKLSEGVREEGGIWGLGTARTGPEPRSRSSVGGSIAGAAGLRAEGGRDQEPALRPKVRLAWSMEEIVASSRSRSGAARPP